MYLKLKKNSSVVARQIVLMKYDQTIINMENKIAHVNVGKSNHSNIVDCGVYWWYQFICHA